MTQCLTNLGWAYSPNLASQSSKECVGKRACSLENFCVLEFKGTLQGFLECFNACGTNHLSACWWSRSSTRAHTMVP